MRFLTLALGVAILGALPLSASQRIYFRGGACLQRPVVVVRPAPYFCEPAPVIVLGSGHRWHRHHRRVIVLR